jgi:hypothetical protein
MVNFAIHGRLHRAGPEAEADVCNTTVTITGGGGWTVLYGWAIMGSAVTPSVDLNLEPRARPHAQIQRRFNGYFSVDLEAPLVQ